ncbi:MAG: HypC/HybG/HupF family hydrogenase formation chaperone [Pyrinomonadaceae bacterium]|nr:HypC/HybG/HupF family hydrogenase formation chaperone [Pyrinomonadaceae bacterium]MBA3571468.1 HypC/HybG/HupF family hydrogenase formation chaperone [Pyrinomonadaceae bacterium]MDQ3175073.1 HypC/HybG/HupF family hydrogenase formation chaperone [Acidobacteriota bacterium]
MCLAIPGKIVEIVDIENQIAKVDVGGVKRNINIGMLGSEEARVGDYVLIHVGFAMSKVDEQQAHETLQVLKEIGEFDLELEQFKTTVE